MIDDSANPLNYKIPNPLINSGIELAKSIYRCNSCNKEYDPWIRAGSKLVMTKKCADCIEKSE